MVLPVVDSFLPEAEQYLPRDPEEVLKTGQYGPIPVLMGTTSYEGVFLTDTQFKVPVVKQLQQIVKSPEPVYYYIFDQPGPDLYGNIINISGKEDLTFEPQPPVTAQTVRDENSHFVRVSTGRSLQIVFHHYLSRIKKKRHDVSPQGDIPTERPSLLVIVVPTFADKECHVELLLLNSSGSSLVLTRLSLIPFQTHCPTEHSVSAEDRTRDLWICSQKL
uniref:Uncharacterized protein n=1 Tax=Timema bartmani TaxID=61472 RepID=A0A7R9I741_9NEOP|nr:unnamed protein product [Timema bartmani]